MNSRDGLFVDSPALPAGRNGSRTTPEWDGATHEEARRSVGFGCASQTLLTTVPLAALDLLVIAASSGLALSVGYALLPHVTFNFAMYFLPLAALFLVAYSLAGLYPGVGLHPSVELRQSAMAGGQVLFLLLVILAASQYHHRGPWSSEGVMLGACALSMFAIPILRSMIRPQLAKWRWWGHPTIIFGGGKTGMRMLSFLRRNPGMGLRPVGIIDDLDAHWRDEADAARHYLGPPADAVQLARDRGAYWGVLALGDRTGSELLEVVNQHAAYLPHLLIVTDFHGLPSLWNRARDCGGLLGIQVKERLLLPLPRLVKRTMDLVFTVLGGLMISPLLLILAISSKLSSPGPVFYSQERIGLDGRKFRAWKFRTMIQDADQVLEKYLAANPQLREEWERDHKLKHDPRVTWVGQFLRKTSLDELPQLWNVITGEMSLVGPRPIVQAEIVKYADCFPLYTKVRPGISGLWQISGRNNTTYEERVEFDRYYVRNWSPWFDLYILICTVRTVVLREGAY